MFALDSRCSAEVLHPPSAETVKLAASASQASFSKFLEFVELPVLD